jgi:glycosyltransferase involved in cell wall biosynthesis
MSNVKISYVGSGLDYSGYGQANRAFITALYLAGVDVTTETCVQVRQETDVGWEGSLVQSLENRKINYKIKIIHLTPDLYPKYMEDNMYHIGHLFWETDKLPKDWVPYCNKMQEIWTSSPNMEEIIRRSGVNIPTYSFPQPIDSNRSDKKWGRYAVPYHKGYLFYSVFQWIERKNPRALLNAYWEAFKGVNDVGLMLKVFRQDYSRGEFEKIKDDIRQWKASFANPMALPPVYLIKELMTYDRLFKLHNTADCYVSADRGEGWSRPIMEALLMGKTVISTARGGIHEYLKPEHYFAIDSEYVGVEPQTWVPFYTNQMKWAEVNKEDLKTAMIYAYKNPEIANSKGIIAKEYIKANFNYFTVGQRLKERLEKIWRAL